MTYAWDNDSTHSYDYCRDKTEKWANSEYVEPPVDWSKVAVDTPILIRDSSFSEWGKRYFAKYENGIVYAWNNGTTSWSGDRCTPWKLAKLPERSSNGEINGLDWEFPPEDIGKTVFLVKSEAEQWLKEINTDNGITE